MNPRTKMLQALFMSMQIRPESNPMDAAIILQSLCDAMEAETPMEAVASILQLSRDQEKIHPAINRFKSIIQEANEAWGEMI